MDNRRDILTTILIIGFLTISLLNAVLHDPYVGYDVGDFTAYIKTLSDFRLPDVEDSDEYFTPPLPFIIPALLHFTINKPVFLSLKLAQLINVLLGLGSVLAVIRISNLLSPGDIHFRNFALISLVSLPVFYKSNALIRSEPYLVFFILLYIEQLIILGKRETHPLRHALFGGGLFGAALLSRQWGILILPGVFVYAVFLILSQKHRRRQLALAFTFSGILAFLVSGWFYLSLQSRFGSVTAFNREPAERFSLKNKPASFYIGLGNGQLFRDPVRDSFNNQLFPILYSETWGDYWEFFLVYGKDLRTGKAVQGDRLIRAIKENQSPAWLQTNRYEIASYLGRVNLVSLIPSAIAVTSFVLCLLQIFTKVDAKKKLFEPAVISLFTGMILSTFIGYLWFLIQYPTLDGDTIKSTYILHIFPLLALLIGFQGSRLSKRKPWAYPIGIGIFLVIFIHNIGTMLTRYQM
jgi:hypothetical protein